mmetsp:Transcript_19146/g.21328  ORF Transcript_19146/g.21328 Transcript_19146/m.21328 type:complete len:617 (+) Transcript_19146:52-1902(+)
MHHMQYTSYLCTLCFVIVAFYLGKSVGEMTSQTSPCANDLSCYLSQNLSSITLGNFAHTLSNHVSIQSDVVVNSFGGRVEVTCDSYSVINGEDKRVTFENIDFVGCQVIINHARTVSVTDCIFRDLNAINNPIGGALTIFTSAIEITRTKFINNTVKRDASSKGAGLFITAASSLDMSQCHFIENSVVSLVEAEGGAMFVDSVSQADIDGCLFDRNSVESHGLSIRGGAVFSSNTILVVKNSVFLNNSLSGLSPITGVQGCAIYSGSALTIESSYFSDNCHLADVNRQVVYANADLNLRYTAFHPSIETDIGCGISTHLTFADSVLFCGATSACGSTITGNSIPCDVCNLSSCCGQNMHFTDPLLNTYMPCASMFQVPTATPTIQSTIQPTRPPEPTQSTTAPTYFLSRANTPTISPKVNKSSTECSSEACLKCSANVSSCTITGDVLNNIDIIVNDSITITGDFINNGTVTLLHNGNNPLVISGCFTNSDSGVLNINVSQIDPAKTSKILIISSSCVVGSRVIIQEEPECYEVYQETSSVGLHGVFSIKQECDREFPIGIVAAGVGVLIVIALVIGIIFTVPPIRRVLVPWELRRKPTRITRSMSTTSVRTTTTN